ncbi:MAG: BREX-6 system adenine-specific DNA-methyltransferase PglX [Deltaproteobacteria bacterium]|nr:BREX-6 system adenine-specific DNA-methyltransferase PglX [Deltaproteobacteria bacterium]
MTMTPEAKGALSTTIRGLRVFLLEKLHDAVEGAYRMSVRERESGLTEVPRRKRRRLEEWIDEQVRIEVNAARKKGDADEAALRARFRSDAEKQAAYTLLNRVVILRLMEASKLREPEVITNGWESAGYKAFRQLAQALRDDDTEGYGFLVRLIFDDLAVELPGLFGPAGIADLIPIPAATLKYLVEALNDGALETCWGDDMTLGWVYQYWNDPEREMIDAKINEGGKVDPHEIASKTQMFTERYMVDWLLQNSLGPTWLAICKKNGWVPDVESEGVIDALEARRQEWRSRRIAGQVPVTELMPLHSDVERHWAYYLQQPVTADAVASAPQTVRQLKLLDPAVGSGHFLVVAFDLLLAFYCEEARHRGLQDTAEWQPRAIVESILENNLYGIDLDPRAVQIAAAAIWMKARKIDAGANAAHMNLVASALRVGKLTNDDPSLVDLGRQLQEDAGIPTALTNTIVQALRDADHLGTLLKFDRAVDDAIVKHEHDVGGDTPTQPTLFAENPARSSQTRASVVDALERFLARHTRNDELGLRMRGEQLASGVRFVRFLKEGTFHLVVGNPPYLATARMRDNAIYKKLYGVAGADYFAGFFLRGLELVAPGGICGFVTLSNWMFLKSFSSFREHVLKTRLVALADFGKAAFSTGGTLISTSTAIFRRSTPGGASPALRTYADYELKRDDLQPRRTEASLRCHVGRHDFDPNELRVVPEWPLVYWWSASLLNDFRTLPLLGAVATTATAQSTGDNARYRRHVWEVAPSKNTDGRQRWFAYVGGADGAEWFEPQRTLLNWADSGIQIKLDKSVQQRREAFTLASEDQFGRIGLTFPKIGYHFSARMFRVPSIFGDAAPAVFPPDPARALALLNSRYAKSILADLNPTINFGLEDAERLPLRVLDGSDEIFRLLEEAFGRHESHREPSPEFRQPGPSPWRAAQRWAQDAVDRPAGAPLEPFIEEVDAEPDTDHLSYALGVAVGRFGDKDEGIVDAAGADLHRSLTAGVCYLDGTLDADDFRDSLGHTACARLKQAWLRRASTSEENVDLRTWLRTKFFSDVHKDMYDNRPIHWALSSRQKTFVALVNIHRLDELTLRVLLADHLEPTRKRIEGEMADLRAVRDGPDKPAAKVAEKRLASVQKAHGELELFLRDVEACAERGAGPVDASCRPRERDKRFAPDLDDGVMINSAALWPLLDPQWKDPKKWWKEISNASGKKDYDWSRLAMLYWPKRVDEKCQQDPSVAVAHGCFWRYHPARAWAWELWLQGEIGPAFKIEEKAYDPFGRGKLCNDTGDAEHRTRYLKDQPSQALETVEREVLRRVRKHKKPQSGMKLLEPGLWSSLPHECWALELRISEKQGAEFLLLAPDEAEARQQYIKENAAEVEKREQMLAKLEPMSLLADADADDDDADDDEEAAQ